jgi:plasmid stabilization system protein ParE
MDAFDIDRMFDGYVPEEQAVELRSENERLRAALEELLDEVSGGNEPSPEMLGRARAALEYK